MIAAEIYSQHVLDNIIPYDSGLWQYTLAGASQFVFADALGIFDCPQRDIEVTIDSLI